MIRSQDDQQLLIHHITELIPVMGIADLKIDFLEVQAQRGIVDLTFDISHTLSNPRSPVQSGKISAMLDACMALAGVAKSGGTLDMRLQKMNTIFLRAPTGSFFFGRGKTMRLGGKLALLEAFIFSEDGELLAKTHGEACPTPFPKKTPVGHPAGQNASATEHNKLALRAI